MTLIGTRAMVAAGLDMKTNALRTKPRTCELCGQNNVVVEHDGLLYRIHACDDCGALHVMVKSRPVPDKPGAFYAGWDYGFKLPRDWAPQFLAHARAD